MNTHPWYSPISGRANTISSTSGGKTFSPLILTMSSQRPIVPDSIMSSCRPQLHCCHGMYTARSRVRKRISGEASFSRCVTTISPTSPGATGSSVSGSTTSMIATHSYTCMLLRRPSVTAPCSQLDMMKPAYVWLAP